MQDIRYNRTLFPEYHQVALEQDIIEELGEQYHQQTHAEHIIILIWYLLETYPSLCQIRTFLELIALKNELLAYLKKCGLNWNTLQEELEQEIAPQVLALLLGVLRPDVFLSPPPDEQDILHEENMLLIKNIAL